jgi:uncharacterized protein YbjT (DUF2867 family)
VRVAVTRGSGTLGHHIVEELRSRGHDVRSLSRRSTTYPVDLRTGAGLPDAVAGCEVVIDASNDNSKHAEETLVGGSARLLAAERAIGARHHICVSIIGCDKMPLGYFRIKVGQEQVVQESATPWTIVRATQFHELISKTFASLARWHVLPLPRARLQPIASAEVALAIADVAEGNPPRGSVSVAGPEITDARDLARAWRSIAGAHALILPVPVPGKLGRALREGALTADQPNVRGSISFAAWLKTAHQSKETTAHS